MDVREATLDDADAIRDVARRSLEASYSLSPSTIESAVEQWYHGDELDEKLADDDLLFLVVEDGDDLVGFAETAVVEAAEEADLLWLHVSPEHRGHGAGVALFDAVRDTLAERDVDHFRGRVLADNAEGNDFYERQGFEKIGETEVEIDGRPYLENVYVDEAAVLEPLAGPDGQELYVDRSDADRGTKGGFATVFTGPEREHRYGYLCTNCDALVTAMDTMGRLECGECGNHRKPDRWDAAYL